MTPFATALFRHLLTALGGWLVQRGYTDTNGAEQILGGITVSFGILLSWVHKAGVSQQVQELKRAYRSTGSPAAILSEQVLNAAAARLAPQEIANSDDLKRRAAELRAASDLDAAAGTGPLPGDQAPGFLPGVIPCIIAALLICAGCASRSGGSGSEYSTNGLMSPQRIKAVSMLAAYAGARADIASHPEHRDAFVLAQSRLQILVDQEAWDMSAAAMALAAAPVAQLDGSEGSLYLSGGLAIADLLGIGTFDASQSDQVKALLIGANDGLKLAVGATNARGAPRRSANADTGVMETLRAEAEATRTTPTCRPQ